MLQFTQKDFESNDGMLTSVWGPVMWHMLHTISFNYPVNPTKKNIKDYYKFFKRLITILPCGTCRKNLKKNLKLAEFGRHYFTSRDVLSRFVYKLHEIINKMLNKESNLTYDDIRNKYELLRARCVDKNTEGVSVCKVPDKKDHKGCSEWLHGNNTKKPCTYIVITSDDKNNKFHKMLKEVKNEKNMFFGNENTDTCKIVIGDDIVKTCQQNIKKRSGGSKKILKKYSKKYYKLSKKNK